MALEWLKSLFGKEVRETEPLLSASPTDAEPDDAEPDEASVHRAAVRLLLDKQEAEKERDTDMSLATAVEVLDDLRALIGQSVEIRDQLQALTRREAPKFLEQLCKHLGHSSEEVVAAVAKAREECRIDLDEYRLQHAPEVQRKMKEQFDIDVKPGKD